MLAFGLFISTTSSCCLALPLTLVQHQAALVLGTTQLIGYFALKAGSDISFDTSNPTANQIDSDSHLYSISENSHPAAWLEFGRQ